MNDSDLNTVSGVTLSLTKPTSLAIKELDSWVIWQFPRRTARLHHAAVKPPVPGHGWYPATVDKTRSQVTIYANIDAVLDSPEAALRQLDKLLAA